MKEPHFTILETPTKVNEESVSPENRLPSESNYRLKGRTVVFPPETRRDHQRLRTPLRHYVLHARLLVALSAPLIYLCSIPFVLLDLFITIYHAICFPIYGIPKVLRSDYFLFDRSKLRYLNGLERLNCRYCSYANGLIAYVREVVARTEQHWCPIKHARRVSAPHSMYERFLPYGDASRYRAQVEEVRSSFRDLKI